MINSTVAIFITVSSILVGLYYLKKIDLTKYKLNGMKLYLARAGIGIIPVFLGATILYFLLSL